MSQRSAIMDGIIDSIREWARQNERDIKTIVRDLPQQLTLEARQLPAVFIIDPVEEEVLVEDDTHFRMRCPIYFAGYTAERTEAALHEDINTLYDDLREWIVANYLMPDGVLKLQFVESSDGRFEQRAKGEFLIRCDLIYSYTKAVS